MVYFPPALRGCISGECARTQRLGAAFDWSDPEVIRVPQKSQREETYFVRFNCCPPLVAILNGKAGVLRESFLTRVGVSQARVKRL
jgi:hypothetical protein